MASAQVLRKQEQLAAGRRKLEEFRRKKAAEKAKKAVPNSLLHSSDGLPHERQLPETKEVHAETAGVDTSDAFATGGLESSGIVEKNQTKESDTVLKEYSFVNNEEYKDDAASVGSSEPRLSNCQLLNGKESDGSSSPVVSGVGNDRFLAHHVSSIQEIDSASSHSSYHVLDDYPLNNNDGLEKNLSHGDSGTSGVSTETILPENSVSMFLEDNFGNSHYQGNSLSSSPYQESVHSTTNTAESSYRVGQKISAFPDIGENKTSGSVAQRDIVKHSSSWSSDYGYDEFKNDNLSSSNHAKSSPSATGRRSRPSFLDSIHISKGPLSSSPIFGEAKTDSSGSKVSHKSTTSSIASGNGVELFNHVMEGKHDRIPHRQNEDFSALEQHIEDLTREKFSLQRGLEASRALAESLASENSALTDSFNQQGSIVNQLKFDLERLQQEINDQLVELEAVKFEYANAQLECNAADERAKLLASEVIGLEEKALRLRSNELKLERQVENYQAEISSHGKKMSRLEKECQDLQSTINALLEEKKLLQSKLWKATSSGKSVNIRQASYSKKDVSTSTEDLDVTTTDDFNSQNSGTASLGGDGPSSQFLHDSRLLGLEGLSLTVPSDQMRIIQNINMLIVELALEKNQLMQALSEESSQNSTLLELNKELTQKLEVQTQRLELLTAQSMANDNILPRQLDHQSVHENTPYADEGDEVVERVLGWIMKLFPGGPSRRRTSKHL